MPLVTIFVQVYNTRKYVAECLRSVCSLEGNYDIEILVIDDASPDNSAEIIRTFDDPRIKFVLHDKNLGANATANEGYQLARGKYVARLDSDDRYCPEFLVKSVPLLEQHDDVGFTYADISLMDSEGVITSPCNNILRPVGPSPRNELFEILKLNYVPAPTTLMRKEALKTLLPIPSRYHFLDWYLTTGVAGKWQCAYVDQVLADYRVHSANMHKSMLYDKTGEEITFSVLDRIFSDNSLAKEKRKHINEVYASNYLVLADKYFGAIMNSDARRCYAKSLLYKPSWILQLGLVRRMLGSCIPRSLYTSVKALVKRRLVLVVFLILYLTIWSQA